MALKYWNNGRPSSIIDSGNDTGTTKYWSDGKPYAVIFEVVTSGGNIKSFLGVPWANVKKAISVDEANIKSLLGITN